MHLNFSDLRIKNKIINVFLPTFLITVFIIIGLAGYITRETLIRQAKDKAQYELILIANNIDKLHEIINSCGNQVVLRLNDMDIKNKFKFKTVDELMSLQALLSREKVLYPRVAGLSYVDLDGLYYTTRGDVSTPIVGDINKSQLFKTINGIKNHSWVLIDSTNTIFSSKDLNQLTYAKRVIDIDNFTSLGFVLINVRTNEFEGLYKENSQYMSTIYYIIQNNRIISSNNIEKIGSSINQTFKNGQIIEYEGDKNLVLSRKIIGTGWNVVSLTKYNDILKPVYNLILILSVVGFLVIVFVIFITLILAHKISEPIQRVTDHINLLEDGNLCKFERFDNGIEMNTLVVSFNEMIDRIVLLIQKNNNTEKQKSEYELALLQAQIKPHFLYNTLDVIVRLAALDRKNEVIVATKSIADFYRIALSKGSELITVSKEVELVENYLYIQKTRYPNVFDYIIDVQCEEKSLENSTIPKFTLQPIVENAIYHGLKVKKSKGVIKITITENQNHMFIEVHDNGVGIEEQKLRTIMSNSTNDYYALSNVNRRLNLYFGDESYLDIKSNPGEGTWVKCIINKGIELVVKETKIEEGHDKIC